MEHNERLHPQEILSTSQEEQREPKTVPARENIERIYEHRIEMLAFIQSDIDSLLYEQLSRKIQHEGEQLMKIQMKLNERTKRAEHAAEVLKRPPSVLDPALFVRKPLSSEHF